MVEKITKQKEKHLKVTYDEQVWVPENMFLKLFASQFAAIS